MHFNFHSNTIRRKLVIVIIILSLVLLFVVFSSFNSFPKASSSTMGHIHIVLFRFKSTASPEAINHISQQMLALKDTCIHPTSNKPYIKSTSGGVDNSPEGIQNGMTHAFIMEFDSIEDRDYYVNDDPTHDQFKKLAGEILEKAQVVDFTDRVFK